MSFQQSNQTLIKLNDGTLWHLFHSRNEGIQYRIMDQNNEWSSGQCLAHEAMKDFSVGLDDKKHVHLIYQTKSGEIRYMRHNGSTWGSQILSTFEPTKHIIRYPTILAANQKIHVIFALGTAFNVGLWTLYHYYWNGSTWAQYEICRFTGGKNIGSFQIDTHQGDIHLCYRGMDDRCFQIFYTHFTEEYSIWSTPENISNSSEDCSYPSILTDEGNSVHFTWVSLVNANMHIYYYKRPLYPLRGFSRNVRMLSNGFANCIHPILTITNNRLWLLWVQNEQIKGIYLEKEGKNWSNPEMIQETENRTIYLYRYLTKWDDEKERLKTLYLFANTDNPPAVLLPDPDIHIIPSMETLEPSSDSDVDNQANPLQKPVDENIMDGLVKEVESSVQINVVEESVNEEQRLHETPSPDSHSDISSQNGLEKKDNPVEFQNQTLYLEQLLQDLEELGTLKRKLENLLHEVEKNENRQLTDGSLERRFDNMESILYTLQEETDGTLQRVYQSEAELQQLCASLQNFERELMDLQITLNQFKEKKLLRKIISSLKIK